MKKTHKKILSSSPASIGFRLDVFSLFHAPDAMVATAAKPKAKPTGERIRLCVPASAGPGLTAEKKTNPRIPHGEPSDAPPVPQLLPRRYTRGIITGYKRSKVNGRGGPAPRPGRAAVIA